MDAGDADMDIEHTSRNTDLYNEDGATGPSTTLTSSTPTAQRTPYPNSQPSASAHHPSNGGIPSTRRQRTPAPPAPSAEKPPPALPPSAPTTSSSDTAARVSNYEAIMRVRGRREKDRNRDREREKVQVYMYVRILLLLPPSSTPVNPATSRSECSVRTQAQAHPRAHLISHDCSAASTQCSTSRSRPAVLLIRFDDGTTRTNNLHSDGVLRRSAASASATRRCRGACIRIRRLSVRHALQIAYGLDSAALSSTKLFRYRAELILPVRLHGPLRRLQSNVAYGAVVHSLALGFGLVLDLGSPWARRCLMRTPSRLTAVRVVGYAEGGKGAVRCFRCFPHAELGAARGMGGGRGSHLYTQFFSRNVFVNVITGIVLQLRVPPGLGTAGSSLNSGPRTSRHQARGTTPSQVHPSLEMREGVVSSSVHRVSLDIDTDTSTASSPMGRVLRSPAYRHRAHDADKTAVHAVSTCNPLPPTRLPLRAANHPPNRPTPVPVSPPRFLPERARTPESRDAARPIRGHSQKR
ncbi:hypothetical protein B0H16DRAFT_1900266 [Mycena metata]|uniref:Uncharacterized protein n=1 Tax=Mycena metata TaxID=1033252 RepID=A0AAD7H4E2_9AGAR|nr:hypothetical protein B0H16DRAFT_1900266 [Mycena metata]